ncbi:hypothetical protein BX616_002257 [Lobosporangium transversale]|uniref:MYND-type domain-containing protein n=1 Tax=Lobosporangium transversale TaxID=64571 RepID=A0A1Y2GPH8_9FUNG|nr:hypothetical protein BCR41DRAFT_352709 [Lobosporangium transversale]KAF9901460.1 hypothetical protein BX616_002257 [Lobosporangium transversale]ORZ17557.1 hypothetical protein BCR41DRAFT_352709 [Lobosporangium transversale]|eukprot:XP_021881944.1 hypothetical protein BCR41DRAFT_352709 [Lobosporangium transversale]
MLQHQCIDHQQPLLPRRVLTDQQHLTDCSLEVHKITSEVHGDGIVDAVDVDADGSTDGDGDGDGHTNHKSTINMSTNINSNISTSITPIPLSSTNEVACSKSRSLDLLFTKNNININSNNNTSHNSNINVNNNNNNNNNESINHHSNDSNHSRINPEQNQDLSQTKSPHGPLPQLLNPTQHSTENPQDQCQQLLQSQLSIMTEQQQQHEPMQHLHHPNQHNSQEPFYNNLQNNCHCHRQITPSNPAALPFWATAQAFLLPPFLLTSSSSPTSSTSTSTSTTSSSPISSFSPASSLSSPSPCFRPSNITLVSSSSQSQPQSQLQSQSHSIPIIHTCPTLSTPPPRTSYTRKCETINSSDLPSALSQNSSSSSNNPLCPSPAPRLSLLSQGPPRNNPIGNPKGSVSTLTPLPAPTPSPFLLTPRFSISPHPSRSPSPSTASLTTSTTFCSVYSQRFLPPPITRRVSSSDSLRSALNLFATQELQLQRQQQQQQQKLQRQQSFSSFFEATDLDMVRQRSQSTSSLNVLAKSPTCLTSSLSTSVALYDQQQPPRTLQDILLLAQSHYISHRYVPALTLYKLAAEKHHSLPACGSLYALYTSTSNVPGLVKSDVKAVQILLHALRIWSARRWSLASSLSSSSSLASLTVNQSSRSRRSKIQDDHDELEEYFAQPRRPTRTEQKHAMTTCKKKQGSIPIRTSPSSKGSIEIATSAESEYRNPMSHLDNQNSFKLAITTSPTEEDSDNNEDEDCEDCEDCEECNGNNHEEDNEEEEEEYDELEKEEEARRIGLATPEIEDLIQKLCLMIQKRALGLDEPVLVEAVSTLRNIERRLNKEAEAWKQELAASKSLFSSSLSGNGGHNNGNTGAFNSSFTPTDLLLTQGIDLSFLNVNDDENDVLADGNDAAVTVPLVRAQSVGYRQQKQKLSPPARASTHPMARNNIKAAAVDGAIRKNNNNSNIVNPAIQDLSVEEREKDQVLCRALRIRIMFTLGWVHQQKGEYHYGAQAYGVCSEIPTPTSANKRLLSVLQQQALVHKKTCFDLQKKMQQEHQEQQEQLRRQQEQLEQERKAKVAQPTEIQGSKKHHHPQPLSPNEPALYASSTYTNSSTESTSTATTSYPGISSPSSLSSSTSDSGTLSMRASGAISSISAAVWKSGFFKLGEEKKKSSIPATALAEAPSTPLDPKLHRSKSLTLGRHKTRATEPTEAQPKEVKDAYHHHSKSQQRPKSYHSHQQHQHQHRHHRHRHCSTTTPSSKSSSAPTAVTLTMSGHQKKAVECGHCGQTRILMPLCVCKKVRYCNGECRVADLERHRETGCHAAKMRSGGSSIGSMNDINSINGTDGVNGVCVGLAATSGVTL